MKLSVNAFVGKYGLQAAIDLQKQARGCLYIKLWYTYAFTTVELRDTIAHIQGIASLGGIKGAEAALLTESDVLVRERIEKSIAAYRAVYKYK